MNSLHLNREQSLPIDQFLADFDSQISNKISQTVHLSSQKATNIFEKMTKQVRNQSCQTERIDEIFGEFNAKMEALLVKLTNAEKSILVFKDEND